MKSVRRIIDRYYLRQIAACFLVSCLFFNTSVLLALEPGNLTGSTGLTGASWGANTVLDTENGAVLNWNNFDTLNGQSVTFNQYISGVLNSSSAVLNRISSGNVPTQFNGALSANGRVFIVNPAGVVFGAGASVNVAQLVASGLNMSDSDFANYISTGNMKFTNHALGGQVANNGTINASQAVYLIGKNVLNSSTGAINCPGGVILMAAGDTVQIAQPGNAVTVTAANPDLREIDNSGELNTSGGQIILAAGDIYSKALGNVDGLSATAEVADVKMSALKDIEVDGDITATGNITLASNTDGIGSGDVDAQKLTAGQTVDIKATNSVINLHDDVKATLQDIILRSSTIADDDVKLDAGRDVVLNDGLFVGTGDLTIEADRNINIGGNIAVNDDLILTPNADNKNGGNTNFTSGANQDVVSYFGSIVSNGAMNKSTPAGNLTLRAREDIELNRYVNVEWGGISIISETGKIFTRGFGDMLNVPIKGFSDQLAGKGVLLPYGDGLAAIVIKSAADLLIGPGGVLMACGNYQPYGGPVDDRSSVGFITEPEYIPAAGSDLRDPGESFDAAIYLASTTGDVDVSSLVTIIPNPETSSTTGAMVIDAYKNVTFDNSDGVPGGGRFENGLKGGFVGDTLEVCSRITEWLQQAAGRLPYPYGGAPVPENYHYVLRGAGLDNPAITDGRAWVLEDKHVPPPSIPRMDLPEIEGCPAVMDAAAQELGIIGGNIQLVIARTLADGRSIQPCDSCGRLLRSAEVLSDDGGQYLAALVEVINTIAPPEKPFSPELAAQIAFTIQSLKDGSPVYESAKVYIDAFVEYASILKREINAPIDDPLIYVLEKYGQGLLANPNTNAASYVAAQIEAAIK